MVARRPKPPPPPRPANSAFVDDGLLKKVATILKESGAKLKLRSRWWAHGPTSTVAVGEKQATGVELESITRSYCRSVEERVLKFDEDLKELRAFVEYLEEKVLKQ